MTAFLEFAFCLGWKLDDLVTAYWGYFDETGHPADPRVSAFGIGGLRATCRTWVSFNEAWQRVLAPKGITAFHMKEVYAPRSTPYGGWSDDDKTDFLMALIDVIEMVKPPLGAMRSLVNDVAHRDRMAEAYREAYHDALHSTLTASPSATKVHFVFAKHPEISEVLLRRYHGWIMDAYQEVLDDDRVGAITFGEPADLPPLQAADLIAWELRRHQANPTERRPTLLRLLDMGAMVSR